MFHNKTLSIINHFIGNFFKQVQYWTVVENLSLAPTYRCYYNPCTGLFFSRWFFGWGSIKFDKDLTKLIQNGRRIPSKLRTRKGELISLDHVFFVYLINFSNSNCNEFWWWLIDYMCVRKANKSVIVVDNCFSWLKVTKKP